MMPRLCLYVFVPVLDSILLHATDRAMVTAVPDEIWSTGYRDHESDPTSGCAAWLWSLPRIVAEVSI